MLAFFTIIGFGILGTNRLRQETPQKREVRQVSAPNVQQSMKITSSVFTDGQPIPKKYTCDGENISPPLSIANIPQNTKNLALIIDDPDAPGRTAWYIPPSGMWTHWIVWNIDPSVTEIREGEVPASAVQGTNDFRKISYGGPCPPTGTHRYVFTLYVLDAKLSLVEGSSRKDFESFVNGHILEQAQLTGIYGR